MILPRGRVSVPSSNPMRPCVYRPYGAAIRPIRYASTFARAPVRRGNRVRSTDDQRLTDTSSAAVKTNGVSAALTESVVEDAPLDAVEPSEGGVELDEVVQKELRENGLPSRHPLPRQPASLGFRSTRRTRVICTIGPATESVEMLELLAQKGMNVARLNLCHATQEWHAATIRKIRELNKRKGYSIAVMLDTEGSEVHISEIDQPLKAEVGDELTFTVRKPPYPSGYVGVNYDAFIYDIAVGDQIVVDGGMVRFLVIDKAGPDVHCKCIDPGLVLSRANLTFRNQQGELIRGQNANLSVISAKDWHDIDFAIEQRVDFIAVSFVKKADVLVNLKDYIQRQTGSDSIEIIAKIESVDSLTNLDEIAKASDGLMVARGDLGAQVALEEVPSLQKRIVVHGRELGIPVIVASHLLQSMLENPIPTRAEAADVADVVRQQADALMLCSESAVGMYCDKAVDVLTSISTQIEEWCRTEKFGAIQLPDIGMNEDQRIGEELCAGAVMMANQLNARAIFVFTRRGFMANILSRLRPDCPIFAFTDNAESRRRLNLRWGVCPFLMEFDPSPEKNVQRTFTFLKVRTLVEPKDLVIVVSDIRPNEVIRNTVRIAMRWATSRIGSMFVRYGNMSEQHSDLQRLSSLVDSCRSAPRFGKNAKALLLEAVGEIDEDFEFEPLPESIPATSLHTVPVSSAPVPRPLLTLKELFEAFPPTERPYVAYQPNQKVPRITRQREVDNLASKYLGFLLQERPLTTRQDWLDEIKRNEPMRAAALQAADQHERNIYRATYNETSYKRAIHAAMTEKSFVSAQWWSAQTPTHLDSACSSTDLITLDPPPASKQLSTDDTPEGSEEAAVKLPKLESVPEAPSAESSTSAPLPPVAGRSDICHQLLAFIKSALDPYFAASLLSRDTYKKIAQKVQVKVMAAHPEASTARFLLLEGENIKNLIHRYVKYYAKDM